MKKIKVAVIGVGSISAHHIQSYLADENAELYAFCDINPDRLHLMGERYGVTRLYTDEATMLAELPELDAVSVCTWNSAHAPCSIMALNAGKHVLCEKPMAMNVEEAEAMKEAAEKNGKLLMIGFVRRFGRDCAVAQDMIAANQLGDVYYSKTLNLRRNGNPGGWFGDISRSGGGPLIDLGVHSIDLVRYLMGKPHAVSVYGATFRKLGNRDNIKCYKKYLSASATDHDICNCEDLATAMIRFDNGAVLNMEMSFALNIPADESYIQLFGDKGSIRLGSDVRISGEVNNYLVDTVVAGQTGFDFETAFQREVSHFVNCAITGAPCRNTAEDGVELMKILTAVYRSAAAGHEVVL